MLKLALIFVFLTSTGYGKSLNSIYQQNLCQGEIASRVCGLLPVIPKGGEGVALHQEEIHIFLFTDSLLDEKRIRLPHEEAVKLSLMSDFSLVSNYLMLKIGLKLTERFNQSFLVNVYWLSKVINEVAVKESYQLKVMHHLSSKLRDTLGDLEHLTLSPTERSKISRSLNKYFALKKLNP